MIHLFLVSTVLSLMTTQQVFAASKEEPALIDSVGAISINPSHDAQVLANWYDRFGIPTQEMNGCPKEKHPCIGYYKVAGSWFFAIHPKRKHAPKKSSGSIEIVLHVSDYDLYLANAAKNNVLPQKTESDPTGRFAHFIDPDGNQVTIWGGEK